MSGPGDPGHSGDHRAYAGPAEQYDVIGAAQFALLYALGLREHHTLLDIGCGSLRAGRLLIPYLAPGGYTGVEPNPWLVDAAVRTELGADILQVKRPRFDTTSDFALAHLGRFSFVLAHGIATNTGPSLVPVLLRAIATTLAPGGLAAATFIHPSTGDDEAVPVRLGDLDAPAWRYPGCYAYEREEIAAAITSAGLVGTPIAWSHPRHQWWLTARSAAEMPSEPFLARLDGPTLVDGF